MRKEFLIAGAILGAVELSRFAFVTSTREEILKRDQYKCVGLYGEPCYFVYEYGRAASTREGYLMTAAHLPYLHGQRDSDPSAGRCLCTFCHGTEEYLRGNKYGAREMINRGLLQKSYIENYGLDQEYMSYDQLKEYAQRMRPYYEEYLYSIEPRFPASTG